MGDGSLWNITSSQFFFLIDLALCLFTLDPLSSLLVACNWVEKQLVLFTKDQFGNSAFHRIYIYTMWSDFWKFDFKQKCEYLLDSKSLSNLWNSERAVLNGKEHDCSEIGQLGWFWVELRNDLEQHLQHMRMLEELVCHWED